MAKKKKKKNSLVPIFIVLIIVILVLGAALAVIYVKDVGGMKEKINELISSAANRAAQNIENGGKNEHKHSFGEWTTTKTPTCTEKGERTRECSCGVKEKEEISTISHEYENGVCVRCGKEEAGLNTDLSIHFLELGNVYTGDCVLLDCGDVEILIDAGSRNGSAATIKNYVDQYCEDGKLEYVIATHAHQDHIAGFVGTKSAPGIFASYECETIIEFAKTDATSKVYNDYCAARNAEVEAGAKCYTAAQCIKGEDGAKSEYQIADGVKMTVLDSYYYYNKSGDENNYSVCVLIENGDQHYLFTGDLEKDGEEKLVEMNDLPHCELFKGGHHGSYTASNDVLLNAVTPDNICICCCAGSDEYSSNPDRMFPALDALERMVKHTENIFVTTMYTGDYAKNDTFTSFNGNIVATFSEGKVDIVGSANSIPLLLTEWCKINRPTVYKGEKDE